MGDLFFFIKMVLFTFALMMLMQAKIGTRTVEENVLQWTQRSEIAQEVKKVAEGAIAITSKAYARIKDQAAGSENQKKLRTLPKKAVEQLEQSVEKSKTFIKEKTLQIQETESL